MKYSIGPQVDDEPFHIMTVRSPVTRNLISRFDDIRDEIVESFKEYIPLTEGKLEWKKVYGDTTYPAYT